MTRNVSWREQARTIIIRKYFFELFQLTQFSILRQRFVTKQWEKHDLEVTAK
jgi:hypothetical protein